MAFSPVKRDVSDRTKRQYQIKRWAYVSKCKVKYMDLQGIIPCKSCDFEYHAYHILRLVIITAQIVEIAGFCHLC